MSKSSQELLALAALRNSPNYAPASVVFERGEGVYLYDTDGKSYLDLTAGVAVNSLGYNHPTLTKAICEQAQKLIHVSNLYYSVEQIDLLERLCALSFADRVFFCNSGAEANEAALKLARRYQFKLGQGAQRSEIVSTHRSFHGRTLATVTATGQPAYHEGFEPLVAGFVYAEYNNIESLKALVGPQTAAVILEPIQGEGGVKPASREFLQAARDLCDEHGAVLIFDEVQTGIGRTGSLFAYQHFGITPDIMTLAKGLGGGVPIGAMLATEKIFTGWQRGSHGSTFGGNSLACRAALTVLSLVADDAFLNNVRAQSERLMNGLRDIATRHSVIKDVRGIGLMLGADCGEHAGALSAEALKHGLLLNTAGGTMLRLVPPLVFTDADSEEAIVRLNKTFDSWAAATSAN